MNEQIFVPDEITNAASEIAEEEDIICTSCGCVIYPDNVVYVDGEPYCDTCTYVCDECGEVDLVEYATTAYNNGHTVMVCESCIDWYYEVCTVCEDWVHRDHVEETHDGRCICDACAENHHFCVDCGSIIDARYDEYFETDDGWCCRDCYDSNTDAIDSYSYDPDWEYLGGDEYIYDGYIRYGVELEVDSRSSSVRPNACAQEILDRCSNVYCKHDGSLDRGFEIISHPATLDYHLNELRWGRICDIAREYGFLSNDIGTCGLHVHVGREALCEDADSKIVTLVDHIWDHMETFARRKANSYASRLDADINPEDSEAVMIEKAKGCCGSGYGYDRYKAINIGSKASTIEFRIYKGTLKSSTILATLIFTDCIVRYCNTHTIKQCAKASLADVVAMSDNPILHDYLKARNMEV